MSYRRSTMRTVLFAGVSTLALTVGAAELRAADLAPVPRAVLKAPPPVQAGVLTVWIEGAAFWTGGDKTRAFGDVFSTSFGTSFCTFGCSTNDFGAFKPGVGWEAAGGADYRFAGSPWHVSFDFRYGRAKSKRQAFHTAFTTGTEGCPSCTNVTAQAFAYQHESHMVADFMIGRDLGLGGVLGMSQVKFGLRVADLEARTHIDAQVFASCSSASSCGLGKSSAAAAISLDERSRFIGVGPRGAIEGTVPLGGPWAVDYMGGLAVLFGDRKLDATVSGVSSFPTLGTGLLFFHTQISDSKGVFNADASLALAYWFTPRAKLSAGFRFDGYWQALKTFDLNGNITNVDRFYYGPFVRLTGQF